MCSPAAFAAEEQGISDKRPDRLRVPAFYDLAKVLLIIAIIAAFARLIIFLAHRALRNARDKSFRGIIMQIFQ